MSKLLNSEHRMNVQRSKKPKVIENKRRKIQSFCFEKKKTITGLSVLDQKTLLNPLIGVFAEQAR